LTLQELYTAAVQDANSGQHAESARKLELILTHEVGASDKANICALLGAMYLLVGNNEQGTQRLEEALSIAPNNAEGWKNLSEGLRQLGRTDEAVEAARKALKLKPDYANAYNNMGLALKDQGKLDDAVASYRKALTLKPDYATAYNNMGVALYDQGKLDDAVASYRKALTLKPDLAEAHNNMGLALKDQGKLDDAVASYRKALTLKPDLAEAYNNMGLALYDQGKLDDAVASYRKALSLRPDYAEAYYNMGIAFESQGNFDDFKEAFEKASIFSPENKNYQLVRDFCLPSIPRNNNELLLHRHNFISKIPEFNEKKADDSSESLRKDPRFYLSYHSEGNIDISRNVSSAVREAFPQINFKSKFLLSPPLQKDRRIKVGFCSGYLKNHTIGKLFKGIISNLNFTKFNVIVIHHPKTNYKRFWSDIKNSQIEHIVLPPNFENQKIFLENLRLDILVFPDIGMDGWNYSLAHCRFAPQQIVSWGHPDTTGINSIDNFISSSLIEPIDAQNNYSETLVQFSTLPSYYDLQSEPLELNRQDFSFDESQIIYGCLQTLFKIHPDFDTVLENIAQQDPRALIIFIDSPLSENLKARWKASKLEALLAKSTFLRPMNSKKFLNLMNVCNVLLDPLYFGSGNTFYESAYCGVPQVSFPGDFMRGRIVFGGYKQLELADAPIVSNKNLYHLTAVAWANSADRREIFRREITSKAQDGLFRDSSVIVQYEELFCNIT
jgi:tetratricopeptide (TPR) repeat protein